MERMEKLKILSAAAKYDVSCSSGGTSRAGAEGKLGNCVMSGICHSFAADGRCISLLKVLQSNVCVYDCKYCVNRRSNDIPRTSFTPQELAELTYAFYRRNYIEGLFLSSGVWRSADYAGEQMLQTLTLLRKQYGFNGYIHVKAIPGMDSALVARLGRLADRMSVNIELPSQQSLALLAPDKSKHSVLSPMGLIRSGIVQGEDERLRYRHANAFVPAGQSTQMIVGASPENDFQILTLTQALYRQYDLKRVYYSAYLPVQSHALLPPMETKPPLLREHRLYQADWLLRFYGFDVGEILDEAHPMLNPYLDPKCAWALGHLQQFPVEIQRADYETLLRVPGIGVKSAQRIVQARRGTTLDFEALKRLGVVLKRAQYFITCKGKLREGVRISSKEGIFFSMLERRTLPRNLLREGEQISFFPASVSEW